MTTQSSQTTAEVARGSLPSLAKSGWPPALVTFAFTVVLLYRSGVGVADIAAFSAYAVLCLALPGTLLWRAVTFGTSRSFVTDVACGTGLAYAVELAVYLPARWVGQPRLVLLWPLVVVAASLHSRWRSKVWAPRPRSRQHPAWSWSMAAITAYAVAWVARQIWAAKSITPEGLRAPYPDDTYHLALVSELRHHFPASSPFVHGEPLYYHWFVHGEVAATSWATGIEPIVLLQRLSMLPMIVVLLVGAGALAARLCRSAPLGLVAPLVIVVGGADLFAYYPNLYLSDILYLSPTTTYAQVLLVPAVALVFELTNKEVGSRRWPMWVATALLMMAMSGAKVTLLPIVMAGLVTALALRSILSRRIDKTLLGLVAMAAATFLLAAHFVYGGGSRGLVWDPFVASAPAAVDLGVATDVASMGTGLKVLMFGVFALANMSFAVAWVGFARGGAWRDARAQFLLAACVAGFGATFLLSGIGFAQLYFLYVTPLLLALSAAWGFANVVPRRPPEAVAAGLLAAGVLGALVAGAVALSISNDVLDVWSPAHPGGLLVPFVIVALAPVLAACLCTVAGRRDVRWRGLTTAVVVACVFGMSAPAAVSSVADVVDGPSSQSRLIALPSIDAGGILAARWLRDHSDPTDLVATNSHYLRYPALCAALPADGSDPHCDSRHFWLSGYSERQVWIEGWAYEAENLRRADELDRPSSSMPFWDPDRLNANDRAFTDPSKESVGQLKDDGVSWLFVDLRTGDQDLERLQKFATVRYRSGPFVVLSLP